MKELINAIVQKNAAYGIEVNPPALEFNITRFEKRIGFSLPADFKEFYLTCNGFGCIDDIFNMIPLFGIGQYSKGYGENWFYFSEYMIYSDMWGLRLSSAGQYEIFNGSHPEIVLTSSLTEFLTRFLQGNVFDEGGLYDWMRGFGIKA
jgi:hypothetical protein